MATNPVPDQVDNRVFLPKSSSLLGRCRVGVGQVSVAGERGLYGEGLDL